METRQNGVPQLSGDFASVIKELNKFVKELHVMRTNAMRDYKEIKRHMADNADRVTLENIRSNCMNTMDRYFKLKMDALKLHAVVADKMSPKDAKKTEDKLDANDKMGLSQILAEMKEEFSNKNKK